MVGMQLWFARGSEVSIRGQLVTRVVLGILGDDLAPGQRLPSTRELARRFHLHPNPVSAGYRQLARERWVELGVRSLASSAGQSVRPMAGPICWRSAEELIGHRGPRVMRKAIFVRISRPRKLA
jgi:DNA-binding transcriptional MocR family regulator